MVGAGDGDGEDVGPERGAKYMHCTRQVNGPATSIGRIVAIALSMEWATGTAIEWDVPSDL